MTIVIKGRSFEVEIVAPGESEPAGRPGYRLTGRRGASYSTFRTVPNPDLMFLVGFGLGRFTPDPLGSDVALTDRNGRLELA